MLRPKIIGIFAQDLIVRDTFSLRAVSKTTPFSRSRHYMYLEVHVNIFASSITSHQSHRFHQTSFDAALGTIGTFASAHFGLNLSAVGWF